ncbi:ATP phosphoribosyltransferase [Parvularcula sp. ZS-1/3]|uniref:ATP phosphoribosyltransferase n=1 Tax=Parvularcula mediterranea TaxID=2732508 RepID=A0A7Y3W5D1_9PROT|nr:ATP phosphoribosyltransferase [Parvularcula mediterranea]NNU16655.1 ATP phosphoribosyltransferase [Parvularcula mediterranea]
MPEQPFGSDQPDRLRLAVQKKGRLADDTFDLLKKCGLTMSQSKNRLYARVEQLPIDILLVRDDDIPALVAGGASDLGIVGGNVFEEERAAGRLGDNVPMVVPLGFSKCRLCIALPKETIYSAPKDMAGMRIATSYPALTEAWLNENGVEGARTVVMNGAHEIAPRLGVADAVCDIVSTGGTLDANGLAVAETIYRSEALFIGGPLDGRKAEIAEALRLRIEGVQRSADAKYVMLNAPRDAVDAIAAVLPAADQPTILELAGQSDKVAVHTVCREEVVWEQLEKLRKLGASAILVLDIDKMLA